MTAACNQAVREKLEELAWWCAEQRMASLREADTAYYVPQAGAKASAYSAAEAHIRAEIERLGE